MGDWELKICSYYIGISVSNENSTFLLHTIYSYACLYLHGAYAFGHVSLVVFWILGPCGLVSAYHFTLKMDAIYSSEKLVTTYKTIRRQQQQHYDPEDHDPYFHYCENHKSLFSICWKELWDTSYEAYSASSVWNAWYNEGPTYTQVERATNWQINESAWIPTINLNNALAHHGHHRLNGVVSDVIQSCDSYTQKFGCHHHPSYIDLLRCDWNNCTGVYKLWHHHILYSPWAYSNNAERYYRPMLWCLARRV